MHFLIINDVIHHSKFDVNPMVENSRGARAASSCDSAQVSHSEAPAAAKMPSQTNVRSEESRARGLAKLRRAACGAGNHDPRPRGRCQSESRRQQLPEHLPGRLLALSGRQQLPEN